MKRKLKDFQGITLIALVITIIVLLILAGVAISMLSGENGILRQAANAKQTTSESEDYDKLVLAVQSALVDGLGKVDLSDEGALEKALGSDYNYLGDGLVEKNGKYYTVGEDGTVIKGGAKVGDSVTYIPPEVTDAKWSAEYSGLKDSGISTDTVLNNTLDEINTNSFKVTKWRVLSVKNGKVNLISENQTTGKVYLGYVNGYNNAVKLLNDSCNTLYGDKAKGIEGRSIKIEDIEEKMTEEGLASAHSYKNSAKYGEQDSSPYTNNYNYPTIYAEEKLSVINGVKKDVGLGMSEQKEYYTRSTEPSTVEGVTKSIQPYQTYWSKGAADMKKYLGVTGELTTSTNYELIIPKEDSTTYWVASRCVGTGGDVCGFGVRYVFSGEVNAWGVFYSHSLNHYNSLAIRPVVSLSSDLLIRNVAEDGKVTWSVK